jgi:hypothetical protein
LPCPGFLPGDRTRETLVGCRFCHAISAWNDVGRDAQEWAAVEASGMFPGALVLIVLICVIVAVVIYLAGHNKH